MNKPAKQQNTLLAPANAVAIQAEQWLLNMSPDLAAGLLGNWQKALAAPGDFADEFYHRLFAMQPALVELFPGNMATQKQRMTATLDEAVSLLHEPTSLVLLLQAAGVRHYHYNVRQGHFKVMEDALILTLAERIGSEFSPSDAADWRQFFISMALIMRHALAGAERA